MNVSPLCCLVASVVGILGVRPDGLVEEAVDLVGDRAGGAGNKVHLEHFGVPVIEETVGSLGARVGGIPHIGVVVACVPSFFDEVGQLRRADQGGLLDVPNQLGPD